MLNVFRGQRPDLTPAQVAAVLVAGIPAIATVLSAFGIADLSQAQQDALSDALTWCAVLAGLLIGGDATLRTARNVVDARRDTVAMTAGSTGGGLPGSPPEARDPEVDDAERAVSVSDEDEFSGADDVAAVNGHGEFDEPEAVVEP
jgi:hypothetical protein